MRPLTAEDRTPELGDTLRVQYLAMRGGKEKRITVYCVYSPSDCGPMLHPAPGWQFAPFIVPWSRFEKVQYVERADGGSVNVESETD